MRKIRCALILMIVGLSLTNSLSEDYNSKNSTLTNSLYGALMQGYNLARSVLFFHVSIAYNSLIYGTAFSFNQIAGDTTNTARRNEIAIELDASGNIIALNDGKKTPLFLGSIPRHQRHIDMCKQKCDLPIDKNTNDISPDNKTIGLYTLNREFECDWAGLTQLVQGHTGIKQFKYPTTDFSAPTFIDLLRAVRDLEHRDEYNHGFAYVHCKAGRGRSAVTIAAYLAHVLNKAGIEIELDRIKTYLISRRPQVSLNAEHRSALSQFATALKQAGSFDLLYAKHTDEIEKRDKEFC